MAMKFGLLLPHFGEYASSDRVLEGSKLAEKLGQLAQTAAAEADKK